MTELEKAFKHVQHVAKMENTRIEDLLKELKPLVFASPWISCDDRLPDCNMKDNSFGVPVVAKDKDGIPFACYFGCRVTKKPDFYLFGVVVDKKFTQWMDIPAD